MSEYTKGPWEFSVAGKNWYIDSPSRQITCADEIDDEDLANARLIAAAPDLLEACEEFVRKVECGEARSTRSYAQMKAAIAKAKGES